MLQQKESYDVLRLIEHGQLCYISSENVQGKTLDRYLKYHPVIKKREIFLLLKEIAGQLASFHRCRGNPCYQYVNPYSIVRSEDGRIYFLDMQSEANRSKMIFMQRRDIREYFLAFSSCKIISKFVGCAFFLLERSGFWAFSGIFHVLPVRKAPDTRPLAQ